MMKPHTKSELKPGIFFSPAFYMAYWSNIILKRYPNKVVLTHNKLKVHREMWVGAIMAAANTLASKQATGKVIQHFVGVPDDEPADVDLVRLVEAPLKSGKVGTSIERLKVQLVRCDLDEGETLLSQAMHKNKPTYEGLIVAIYEYGNKPNSDYQTVYDALQQEAKVYPSQFLVVEQVDAIGRFALPGRHYGLSQLYPKKGSMLVDFNDPKAFFRHPEVIRINGRGVTTEWDDLGSFELLPPNLTQDHSGRWV